MPLRLLSIIAGGCTLAHADIVDAQIYATTDGLRSMPSQSRASSSATKTRPGAAARIGDAIEEAVRRKIKLPERWSPSAPSEEAAQGFRDRTRGDHRRPMVSPLARRQGDRSRPPPPLRAEHTSPSSTSTSPPRIARPWRTRGRHILCTRAFSARNGFANAAGSDETPRCWRCWLRPARGQTRARGGGMVYFSSCKPLRRRGVEKSVERLTRRALPSPLRIFGATEDVGVATAPAASVVATTRAWTCSCARRTAPSRPHRGRGGVIAPAARCPAGAPKPAAKAEGAAATMVAARAVTDQRAALLERRAGVVGGHGCRRCSRLGFGSVRDIPSRWKPQAAAVGPHPRARRGDARDGAATWAAPAVELRELCPRTCHFPQGVRRDGSCSAFRITAWIRGDPARHRPRRVRGRRAGLRPSPQQLAENLLPDPGAHGFAQAAGAGFITFWLQHKFTEQRRFSGFYLRTRVLFRRRAPTASKGRRSASSADGRAYNVAEAALLAGLIRPRRGWPDHPCRRRSAARAWSSPPWRTEAG